MNICLYNLVPLSNAVVHNYDEKLSRLLSGVVIAALSSHHFIQTFESCIPDIYRLDCKSVVYKLASIEGTSAVSRALPQMKYVPRAKRDPEDVEAEERRKEEEELAAGGAPVKRRRNLLRKRWGRRGGGLEEGDF